MSGVPEQFDGFALLDAEFWLVEKVRDKTSTLREALFDGVLTPDDRKRILRHAIIDCELAQAIAGKRPGHPCETYAQVFERVYREPLIPKPTRGGKTA